MGSFSRNFGDILHSASTIATTLDKEFQEQARLSTQTKEIQLQTDINNELAQIRQSSNDEEWNTQINDFFTRVKSGMSDKSSPYYCRNNLQAQQFNAIMEQHHVGVSAKVGQMAEQRQSQKRIADVQTAKQNAKQLHHGADLLNIYNELDRSLYESGDLNPLEYQQQKEMNYKNCYVDAKLTVFEQSKADGIKNGKTYEEFKSDFDNVDFSLQHTDIKGLPAEFDTEALDKQINKIMEQSYNAALRDMQNKNGLQLANIEKQMLQQDTWEKRQTIARQGQMLLNSFKGLQLDESRTEHYSKVFDLFLSSGKSRSGSGAGGSGVDYDKFEDFIKAAPDIAVELVRNGQIVNYHDGKRLMSQTLFDSWHYENYKENKDKNLAERQKTWGQKYFSSASEDTLGNQMYDLVIKSRPALKLVFDTQIKPLVDDIKKNPDDYDNNTVIQLSNLWVDTVLGSNANESDEALVERFNKTKNDVILSKTKYLELDKKGKLLKTFNAKSETDVAKAARLVSEGDFLYTYNGNTFGKKAELEAKDGVVDVLKNAFAATRGISEDDYGKIDFFYKPDPLHDDVTSTPVITYKNEAWVVIPKEGDKGFILQNYHNPEETIEGSLKGGKTERTENKKAAGNTVKELSEVRKQIEASREVDDAQWADMLYDKSLPKSAAAAGVTNAEDWNQSDKYTRITMLTSAARKVTKDAHKVEAKKMSEDEFKKKYGFDYSTWNQASTRDKQFYTLLNN